MSLESVFLKLVNMSLSASFLILAVMLVRLIFKKAPKWIICILWGCVALRLLIPFSIESSLSLLPSSEPLPEEILYTPEPMIESGIPPLDELINPILSESLAPVPGDSANPTQIWSFILAAAWGIGMAALVIYAAVSYIIIKRKVRESVPLRDNIRLCDRIPSPFILGVFRPTIYLPSEMNEADASYVIAHENAHLARRDHLWKPLGFALLILHWFNPLVWIGYILLCRDIEIACDEKVIGKMETEEKKEYSEVLLACSVHRRLIAACPLAFGEVGVKERIKNVLNYKKPAFWIIVLALIVCVVTAICFLTNPPSNVDERLAVFLDCQIAEHHQNEQTGDNFCALDYQVLGKRTRGDTVTVYMWVLYEEFSFDPMLDGGVKKESGAHTATVITAKKDGDHYTLVEYWTPRDGSYYADDIRDKFPLRMWADAMDSEKFYKIQAPLLAEMAYEHYTENPPVTDSGDSTDIANVGGTDVPASTTKKRKMTINDVLTLSEKGDDLTWEDFAPFKGSDMYNYSIDETFYLRINGSYANEKPTDVLLCAKVNLEPLRSIDSRKEDVAAFVAGIEPPTQLRQMTFDDVIALSKKGDQLTVQDFKPFTWEYTGLWNPGNVGCFPISDSFRLYIGYTPDCTLTYAYLYATLYDQRIEIRTGDVAAFIDKHTAPPTHVHSFTDGPYYTTHIALAVTSHGNVIDLPAKHLRYHEVYRDCAACGYTEYLGWVYCGTGKGSKYTNCTGGCANTNLFDHIATRVATEEQEAEIRYLIDSMVEAGFEYLWTCLHECQNIYTRLLAYDDFTLRYIFKCFIEGGQTGLRGDILCELLKALDPEHVLALDADNGQMYFSAWENSVKRVRDQHGDAWMEENYPTGALLLRMLNMQ